MKEMDKYIEGWKWINIQRDRYYKGWYINMQKKNKKGKSNRWRDANRGKKWREVNNEWRDKWREGC